MFEYVISTAEYVNLRYFDDVFPLQTVYRVGCHSSEVPRFVTYRTVCVTYRPFEVCMSVNLFFWVVVYSEDFNPVDVTVILCIGGYVYEYIVLSIFIATYFDDVFPWQTELNVGCCFEWRHMQDNECLVQVKQARHLKCACMCIVRVLRYSTLHEAPPLFVLLVTYIVLHMT